MPPQIAPAATPARIASGRCTTSGRPVSVKPTQAAAIAPHTA
ncbi:Uncharacterised protein [Mycobacteroides abscessus subsp. abscessus]|nr:Uncharacterised protein [Mycobacteroides abscessus subsp. abscessus]